jgi:hypothetical protein
MRLISLLGTWCALAIGLSSTLVLQGRSAGSYTALGANHDVPPRKYFHESTSCDHCDARFGKKDLSPIDRRRNLSALMRAFLSTTNDIDIETWLMHGSLLGWHWNRKIMPWDTDVDVQITEKSMQHLADYYNMSVHHFSFPGSDHGRDYLLEINPNWANPSTTDVDNKIDGRWVDMASGLYIDITTLRWDEQAVEGEQEDAMICKDGHRYKHKDIFPLRDTTFEGMPAKVPFAYANVLVEEYGAPSLSNTVYKQHQFDVDLQEWMPLPA